MHCSGGFGQLGCQGSNANDRVSYKEPSGLEAGSSSAGVYRRTPVMNLLGKSSKLVCFY